MSRASKEENTLQNGKIAAVQVLPWSVATVAAEPPCPRFLGEMGCLQDKELPAATLKTLLPQGWLCIQIFYFLHTH